MLWMFTLMISSLVISIRGQKFDWESQLINGSLRFFPTYKEANVFFAEISSTYPHIFKSFITGQSVEERPLTTYFLGYNSPVLTPVYDELNDKCLYSKPDIQLEQLSHTLEQYNSSKPILLVFALQHAREPASLVALSYFIRRLLDMAEFHNHPIQKQLYEHNLAYYLLHERNVLVHPIMNPDGYVEIEKTSNYYKRKNNRQTCPSAIYDGVDLNRNFDFRHVSGDRCDPEVYGGQHPFSEPEARAIKCLTDAFNILAALNIHAYGDFWTHPFNCCENIEIPKIITDIYNQLKIAANVTMFESSWNSSNLNYTTNGEADDWLLGKRGIISVGPEVGAEKDGFWPPQENIPSIYQKEYWRYLTLLYKMGAELHVSLKKVTLGSIQVTLHNFGLSSLNPPSRFFIYTCPSAKFCHRIFWEVPNQRYTTDPQSGYQFIPFESRQFAKYEILKGIRSYPRTNGFIYLSMKLKKKLLLQKKLSVVIDFPMENLLSETLIVTIIDDQSNCHTAWIRTDGQSVTYIMTSTTPFHSNTICTSQKQFLLKSGASKLESVKLSAAPALLSFLLVITSIIVFTILILEMRKSGAVQLLKKYKQYLSEGIVPLRSIHEKCRAFYRRLGTSHTVSFDPAASDSVMLIRT